MKIQQKPIRRRRTAMKQLFFISSLAILSIALLSFTGTTTAHPKASVKTLIIDPGHGGAFPGAKGLFSTEKQVSLAIALKLGKVLKKEFPHLKIVFTRTKDENAGNMRTRTEDLEYRANLANESAGDLFISLHCNSAGKHPGGWYENMVTGTKLVKKTTGKGKNKKTTTVKEKVYEKRWVPNHARGTETYIWAANKNAAKINSVGKIEYYGELTDSLTGKELKLRLPDPSNSLEKARMLLYAQYFFNKSLHFANLVEKEFINAGRTSRGVKQRNDEGIWVLQATGMPSVLIELGFISNKEEEQYLNSEKGQNEIVANIVAAIRSYIENAV